MIETIGFTLILIWFNLIGLLPRSWTELASGFMGRLWYAVDKRHRDITIDNMARAYGNEKSRGEITALAKKVFENTVKIMFETGWALRLKPCDFGRCFRIIGMSHVKTARSRGKGVLFLTAHTGNWELLAIAGHMIDFNINVVYRPLDFTPLDRFFKHSRSRFGATVISKSKAMRKILPSLRRGESVALLLDQSADWYDGVYVDFFGRITCTNKAMAILALRTGAPVIPAFMAREGKKFVVEFGPEFPLIKSGDQIKDIEMNTQQYNRSIEAFVRRYPDQWLWIHRRWKKRPSCPWPR